MTQRDIWKLFLLAGGIMAGEWVWYAFVQKDKTGKGFIEAKPGFGVDDILHSLLLAGSGVAVAKFVK